MLRERSREPGGGIVAKTFGHRVFRANKGQKSGRTRCSGVSNSPSDVMVERFANDMPQTLSLLPK